ncbi:MAG: Ultraviolet N-glycosylase/AP lyase [bacterium ADurb.Bin363]|nr:MAG: Ultraviolet N-glycosylase/AP lyase [bacterium ADurb.Bin363]
MVERETSREILKRLKEEYGEPAPMLDYETPFQLMVAVVLSAQCTDERVNKVTKELFKSAGSPEKMAALKIEELETLIKSTGFFRNKAKSISESSKMIMREYNGKLPDTMEELLKLPGVGRKSANVILGHVYGIPGVTVDTHVKRVSRRLGFTDSEQPEKIEKDVMASVDSQDWFTFSNLIITHGRKICSARKPKCEICILNDRCRLWRDKL